MCSELLAFDANVCVDEHRIAFHCKRALIAKSATLAVDFPLRIESMCVLQCTVPLLAPAGFAADKMRTAMGA